MFEDKTVERISEHGIKMNSMKENYRALVRGDMENSLMMRI